MKKIRFTQNKESWTLSMQGRRRTRKDINLLFRQVEQLLQKSTQTSASMPPTKERTCVLVKYLDGDTNESLPNFQARYLLYPLAVFLEEFMSPVALERKLKKYELSPCVDYAKK